MKLGKALTLLVLLGSSFLPGWPQPLSQAAKPSSVLLPENPVYAKNCARCHGKNGEGKHLFGGPSLVSGSVRDLPTARLNEIITDGKGRMPKFSSKLSPEQIETLVRQIRVAGTVRQDSK
jgi:cytochrome c553